MFGFNYNSFKEAVQRVEREKHEALLKEIDHVKAIVEKALTLSFESSSHRAVVNYPGIGI